MENYNQTFYEAIAAEDPAGRSRVVALMQDNFPDIASVVDVGCGVGNWLKAFDKAGIADVLGIDGPWVPKAMLKIAPHQFVEADFFHSFPRIERKFDLAICVEVAEHLSSEKTDDFIEFLTGLADIVFFSAAIPCQGGDFHLNEQWPTYWCSIFNKYGFELFDIIRHQIWMDESLPFWYRQNLLVAVRKETLPVPLPRHWLPPLPLVHPAVIEEKLNVRKKPVIMRVWRAIKDAIRNR